MTKHLLYISLPLLLLASCNPAAPADEAAVEAAVTPRAVVTVGRVQTDTVSDVLELRAVSAYPAKDVLRATTTGYVLAPAPVPGQVVRAGQTVFTLQTKEARTLRLDKITGDPRLRFSGIIRIPSPRGGVLATVDKLAGDYVQDGEQLAMVYDQTRFGFVLDVPVTQLRYVRTGQSCRIRLPDGRVLPGRVAELLPAADLAAQVQRYTVRTVGPAPQLPENVTVTVELDKTAPYLATTLPRSAVLTDETQTSFWIMRLLNDSTAIKVPVQPGQEQQQGRIEIKSPHFSPQDRILVTGNYGLDDTAAVKVGP
ncbi:efflux RND transporter periplasmic adaptor subunit [Hymenobacter rubripertinctus]|uniref:HlyD family efflux transporter periplasmic adaptor subunit n=1 Tax=Hymenobacter rubripertinctus TaxID=2029981 RepID=A0A418QPT9_9BACT|nr:HlyD family efflux transporter periplasmic adaptor subunit [Hymenobacter rubripertinctus]RIY07235.1 HlyD family efflux transporter periplasmic adaptor subunit [Hymenobacter rubripertinctus]